MTPKARSAARSERRRNPAGGAIEQLDLVTDANDPLPPFGRRAGDIKQVTATHRVIKRAADIVVASMAIVVASPIGLVIAVLVKLTSKGPILFKHERVGRGGQRFEVLKFRTMLHGTNVSVWRSRADRKRYIENDFKLDAEDDRITPVGRHLRRLSLDELPQLWNVLRGDMSIVGVRPLVPLELSLRPEIDQQLYCRFRPGITGLWQTSGRSKVSHNQRIAMDRAYAAEWRPAADVAILLKTPATVLKTDESA